jgi:hypothetical protein
VLTVVSAQDFNNGIRFSHFGNSYAWLRTPMLTGGDPAVPFSVMCSLIVYTVAPASSMRNTKQTTKQE